MQGNIAYLPLWKLSDKPIGLGGFAMAAAITGEDLNIPGSAEAVTETLTNTISSIWINFIERSPYLAAAVIILLLTWLASALASRILNRMLKRFDLRGSLKELLDRFMSIGIWIMGTLLAAMIIFPGLTPSKVLGAMGIASIAVGLARASDIPECSRPCQEHTRACSVSAAMNNKKTLTKGDRI